jgi:hypothetical protein
VRELGLHRVSEVSASGCCDYPPPVFGPESGHIGQGHIGLGRIVQGAFVRDTSPWHRLLEDVMHLYDKT